MNKGKLSDIDKIFPLTPMQEGMLFHTLKDDRCSAYFSQHINEMKGSIDIDLFKKSLEILTDRFEIFRTRIFHKKLDKPMQVVLKNATMEFNYIDLSKEDQLTKRNKVKEFLESDRERGFNLDKDTLCRVCLIKVKEDLYENVWSFHHMILDGFCISIIAEDFFKIYHLLMENKEINLPPVVSYMVYEKWLEKQSMDKALDYWKGYLQDYNSRISLPADKNESLDEEETYLSVIDANITNRIKDYSSKNSITVNIFMQAVWGILLQGYNRKDDVVYGNVMAARPLTLKDNDKIVGLFANTVPVRVKADKDTTFEELVTSLNKDFLNSISYSYCSLGEIQEVSSLNHNLVNHLYLFQNFSLDSLYDGAKNIGVDITNMYLNHKTNYDFSIEFTMKDNIDIKVSYNTSKYSINYIEDLIKNLNALVLAIIDNDSQKHIIKDLYSCIKINEQLIEDVLDYEDNIESVYIEPTTELEKELAEIFKEVLAIDKVGINDDFFYLGGNSIKGMKVISQCEKRGIPLKLSELFSKSTIKELEDIINSKGGTTSTVVKQQEKPPLKEDWYKPFKLNDIQVAYLMGQNDSFDLGGFSTQYYTEFEGNIDIPKLEKSINKVIKHQAALRTKILNIKEQVIIENIDQLPINIIDISSYSDIDKEKYLMAVREDMSIHVADIDKYPYFQIKAIKLHDEFYRVCFNVDCLCIDGFGLGKMLQEIKAVYDNEDLELEPINFSVRDYSIYIEEFNKTEKYEEDKKFWRDKLDTLPIDLEIPTIGNPSEIKNPRFLRKEYLLSEEEYLKLKKFSLRNKVTLSSVLCSAYMKVLSLWSNQKDFTVNMTVFDCQMFNSEIKKLIGDFTKLIFIESDIKEDRFVDEVHRVNDNIAKALEHSSYSSMEFSRELISRRHLGTKAALPYVFTCALSEEAEKSSDNEFFNSVYSISRTPQVYIDNQATQRGKTIFLNWDYPEGLFSEDVISEMFNEYIHIITNIKEDIDITISNEDKEFINNYNNTNLSKDETIKIMNSTIMDYIEGSFTKYSEKVAVKDANKSITYGELDKLSDEVASKLSDENVKPYDSVGVMGNRVVETVVNIIGVLKCGATYIPINPEYPEDRIEYMMKKSNCSKCIDDSYINIENLASCRKFSRAKVDPNSNAYIIFTSGSTGMPKGVVIKHNSAINTIIDINKKFNITSSDNFIGLASFGFDLSVYDLFGSLAAGAKLFIAQEQKNPEELIDILNNEEITMWNSVPAVMQMLVSCLDDNYRNTSLKHVLLSGDWIPTKLPSKIEQHFDNAEVISLGGATEGSIWSIYYPIDTAKITEGMGSIPYGMPLSNQKMYILDEKLEFCPVGVKGEICIGGDGVAVGYINDVDKTTKAFITHPTLGYIYRTGDYGRYNKEGYIEFLGRMDTQIKLHGYRIELGEIESKASEIPDIKQAVAVVKKNGAGDSLKLFIESEAELNSLEVKEKLRKKLPEYMIPASIICMKSFPTTQNGKIDRKALKALDITTEYKYRTIPNNDIEGMLADIFKETMEVQQIELDRSFFEIGGDSLKAVKIISDIKNKGYDLSLNDIYTYDTIEKISMHILEQEENFDDDDDFEEGSL